MNYIQNSEILMTETNLKSTITQYNIPLTKPTENPQKKLKNKKGTKLNNLIIAKLNTQIYIK